MKFLYKSGVIRLPLCSVAFEHRIANRSHAAQQ